MPTPSIQTLTTDAQQVLNLDSISAVRSVVAVALANANTGTPLNPNLTTQQLWDQFYQVVTRPKSDIESIIANQLMKFLYSPPAPGGAGADKQVIFNDGGVLAGDADFLWNKTTNLLTVTGSATITGDLTVATDALKVNSSTKDICIGTTTPTFNNKLTVVGGAGGDAFITSGNGTRTGYIGTDGTNVIMGAYSNHPLRIHVNDYPQMEVAALGVFNWYDGAGGTRMTLNSTGLGVGMIPANNLSIGSATYASFGVKIDSITQSSLIFKGTPDAVGYEHAKIVSGRESSPFTYGSFLAFYTEGKNSGTTDTSVERARFNSTGNLAFANGLGIDFSATAEGGAMTSELLNDYEEGGWTGTLKGSTSDPTTPVTATGKYTKIGRQVTVQISFISVNTTGASSRILVSGLPFAASSSPNGVTGSVLIDLAATFTGSPAIYLGASATQFDLYSSVSNGAVASVTHNAGTARSLWFNVTYTV